MNYQMILTAAERLRGQARCTPLLSSPFLDEIAGRRILVKPECLQHTGSFKFRGAWSAISHLTERQQKRGVIAFSSGNHAQGVALAAREHGAPAVIVMPRDAPRLKVENTRALGAEIVLYDRATEDRDAIGEAIAEARSLTLIRPFNDPLVVAGQGTVGLEIAMQAHEQGVTHACVLVPCGGGGLTSGVALALARDAPDMRVHPVEPEGFDDVARGLKSGNIEHNKCLTGSICDAIITPAPGDITFPVMRELCGSGLTASDHDCLRAMAQAFLRLKIVIEPGGAVALAAALFKNETLETDTLIVVASGGNVDTDMFRTALEAEAKIHPPA